MDLLRDHIRDIPDFPQPGIIFKDITPALQSPQVLQEVIKDMAALCRPLKPDLICAIESRGFIFGAAVAGVLGAGFVPIRKPGKLPFKVIREDYSLEYGKNTLEVHTDAMKAGQRVIVLDDVLATGGTACAAGNLVRRLNAEVVGYCFAIELSFLKGRLLLGEVPVRSLLTY